MTSSVVQVNQVGSVSNQVVIASGTDLQIIEIGTSGAANLGIIFPVSPTDDQTLEIVINGGVVTADSMTYIAPYAIPNNTGEVHNISGFLVDYAAMDANTSNYFWTKYRYVESTDTWYKVA